MKHGPQKHKKRAKIIKNRARLAPRGGGGGSHFGPQSCRGLKIGGKMSVPGSPRPPPKVTLKWQSRNFFAFFV